MEASSPFSLKLLSQQCARAHVESLKGILDEREAATNAVRLDRNSYVLFIDDI